jgi:hypothetical protein
MLSRIKLIRIFFLALVVVAAFLWQSILKDSPKLFNTESLGSVAAVVVGSFVLWVLVTAKAQNMHRTARVALPVILTICAAYAALTVSADTIIVMVLVGISLVAVIGIVWDSKREV